MSFRHSKVQSGEIQPIHGPMHFQCARAEEKSFPAIYTGRRLRFTDGKLVFDGDYQEIGDNLIYGFWAAQRCTFADLKGGDDEDGMFSEPVPCQQRV